MVRCIWSIANFANKIQQIWATSILWGSCLAATASERHTKRQTFGAEILRQTRQVQLGHKRWPPQKPLLLQGVSAQTWNGNCFALVACFFFRPWNRYLYWNNNNDLPLDTHVLVGGFDDFLFSTTILLRTMRLFRFFQDIFMTMMPLDGYVLTTWG